VSHSLVGERSGFAQGEPDRKAPLGPFLPIAMLTAGSASWVRMEVVGGHSERRS